MKLKALTAVLLASLMLYFGDVAGTAADIQLPKPDRTNADQATLDEFAAFYDGMEQALEAEDIDRIMTFYADDYLHHGITEKQLRFMWLEIFGEFEDLYSVHVFSRIDVHGSDAIFACTGALLGVPNGGKEYEAVDQWVNQNHWLTKVDGKWKIIGGAAKEAATATRRGRMMELHPLF